MVFILQICKYTGTRRPTVPVMTSEQDREFKCAACSTGRDTLSDIMDHVTTEHNVTVPSQVLKLLKLPYNLFQWNCKLCLDSNMFSNKEELLNHLESHHGPFFVKKEYYEVCCRLCEVVLDRKEVEEEARRHLNGAHQLDIFYSNSSEENLESDGDGEVEITYDSKKPVTEFTFKTIESAGEVNEDIFIISSSEDEDDFDQPFLGVEDLLTVNTQNKQPHPISVSTRRKIVVAQRPSPRAPSTAVRVRCIVCKKEMSDKYLKKHIKRSHKLSAAECARIHGRLELRRCSIASR